MIVRTLLSIYIAEINGSIVKMDFRHFIVNLVTLVLISFPTAKVNSGFKYVGKMFATYLRENLTTHLQTI